MTIELPSRVISTAPNVTQELGCTETMTAKYCGGNDSATVMSTLSIGARARSCPVGAVGEVHATRAATTPPRATAPCHLMSCMTPPSRERFSRARPAAFEPSGHRPRPTEVSPQAPATGASGRGLQRALARRQPHRMRLATAKTTAPRRRSRPAFGPSASPRIRRRYVRRRSLVSGE